MSEGEIKRIEAILKKYHIDYEKSKHEAVFTSEQAARIRGVSLKQGVKSIILRTDEGKFIDDLVPANLRVDTKKLANLIGTKCLKFASPEEVLEETGCEVGAVPPFGILWDIPVYMDKKILENRKVDFNAGLHTVSIKMKSSDLKKVLDPIMCDISKE
jgi:Cys-tRNA(Pro) deacylase